VSLLKGPLFPAVLRVAAPATAFQLLIFFNNVVDYQWVQQLGREAAAGQTQGWTVFWMLLSVGQIFSIGLTAVVARRIGEGNKEAAVHAASHGLRGALLASVLVGALGWLLVPLLVSGNAGSAKAARYTVDYLRTACAGAPFIFWFYATEGAFKGHGDMRRPLRAVATALGLNIVLDPVLIHVAGLQVMGAALATVVSFGLTAALLCRTAVRYEWVRLRGIGIDLRIVGRIVRIGTPVSVHGIIFSGVYVVVVKEVYRAGGDAAAAALGLGIRFEGMAYMIGVGCAAAAAAVVGQNLGAQNIPRARRGAWTAVRLAVYANAVWGLFMLSAPRPVVDWMAPDAATAWYATDYMRIVAVCLIFQAAESVLQGAFSGAGDTLPPMLLGIPMTVLRVPAAIIGGQLFGAVGIFWGLALTSALRGLLFMFWFARNRWIHATA